MRQGAIPLIRSSSFPSHFHEGEGRILIVDDEPDIRETLIDMLECAGYEAVGAEDGAQALERIEKADCDVVISDLHMPGVDGLALIESLKKDYPYLPVVVVTGFPSLDKAVEVMKSGAADFLTKPFELERLLHVVRRTLEESRLKRENLRLMAEVNKKAVIESLNRELHKKVAELTKLNAIAESMARLMDTDELFEEIVQLAASLAGASRVSLMLFDRRRKALRIRAGVGLSDQVIQETVIALGHGVAGKVAETRKPVRITRQSIDAFEGGKAFPTRYETPSWISVPLLIGDELFGVLNVTEKKDKSDFEPDDERVLVNLAYKAAAKIENNALYESLYDNLLDALHSLVTTIEAKDPYTQRHSRRVTDLAVAIAERMNLSRSDIEALRFATILHDIGKIGVRDSILMKPGRLTDEEYQKIKNHPLIGDRIIAPLGLTEVERRIIRHHHERVDGRGYPDGLKGDEICILARIASVADAFDAMTSTRSYRQARSPEEAIQEISRCGGTQFDLGVVQCLSEGLAAGMIALGSPEDRMAEFSGEEMAI